MRDALVFWLAKAVSDVIIGIGVCLLALGIIILVERRNHR